MLGVGAASRAFLHSISRLNTREQRFCSGFHKISNLKQVLPFSVAIKVALALTAIGFAYLPTSSSGKPSNCFLDYGGGPNSSSI